MGLKDDDRGVCVYVCVREREREDEDVDRNLRQMFFYFCSNGKEAWLV